MTDYQEEQNNEIEALASIYPDEFTVLSTEPHCFEIRLKSDNADEDDEDTVVQATLQVTYTPTYPDESPDIEVTFSSNLDDEDLTSLLNLCQEQIRIRLDRVQWSQTYNNSFLAEENLGMVMVFTIVSAVQEKLNEKVDLLKKQILEEEERAEEAKKAKEEAEMAKKFVGTPVTIETFLAWKSKFDQEKTSSRKNLDSNEDSKKLTGRQLFEEDNTLDDSEVALLDEGDNIVVDESLFQELDDLDLDDELDEAIGEDD